MDCPEFPLDFFGPFKKSQDGGLWPFEGRSKCEVSLWWAEAAVFARFLPVLRIQVEENSQSGPVDPAVSLCTEACQILQGDPQHPPEAVRKKAEVFLSRWSISQGRYHEHTPKGISGCCRREHCFLPREIGKLTIGKLLSCQSFLLKDDVFPLPYQLMPYMGIHPFNLAPQPAWAVNPMIIHDTMIHQGILSLHI